MEDDSSVGGKRIAQGYAAAGFEAVSDAFERSLTASHGGGALCVCVDGEMVVDLYGGSASPDDDRLWTADTTGVWFSAGKGVLALLAGYLVDQGRLDLDLRVADYWPEFAVNGKDKLTVRQAFAHQAGLAALDIDIDLETLIDWEAMTSILANQKPLWEPGTAHAYHAITFGWIVGEVLRRASGTTLNELIQLASPAGGGDFWFGVPQHELPRVARLTAGPDWGSPADWITQQNPDDARWSERAMALPNALPSALLWSHGEGFDSPVVHAAAVPGAGGIGTARAVALLYSSAVVETNGTRSLSDRTLADLVRVQSEGKPLWWVTTPTPRWATGFQVPATPADFVSPDSFGHGGAGGHLAFGDRRYRVGFGYVTSEMGGASDIRAYSIATALRETLESSAK